MTGAERMRRFWDERAGEDAFFFVDDRQAYRGTDEAAFWASGEEGLDALLSILGVELDPAHDVVEVGCGVGRMTRAIAARARSVRALDVSERMLALAREHNPALESVEWVHGDGRSLAGIEDASADAVVSHVVFQHIPDPQVTLGYVREIGRVLRPGGFAAFQVSNDPDVHRPRIGLRDRLAALLGRAPRGQSRPEWLGSAVDLGELRTAAAAGGTDVERVEGEGTQFCLVLLRRREA
ncbi:MAG TPA: class I SAM-dependent methyltransferase [Thermoleophilaceae bacterium]|nr:class I SAM-dependent methyltransferase [Thermoleophilaceae bacterium]